METMRSALEAARAYVAEHAESQCYGFFNGGDPRKFTPDEENTEAEHAAHKAACEAWDRGERPEIKRSGRIEVVTLPAAPDGNGGTIPERTGPAIVCGNEFGPGICTYEDEEAMALLARIDAALAGQEVPRG